MRKVIIDTDPGHDDAFAIMLAVKSQMFDILAITTVAGNSTIENTTRNARYILKLLDREDIPVYSGSEKPLEKELVLANVHGDNGLDGLDPKDDANLSYDAVEKIIELVQNNGDVTIVTLGPLTNVAKAIKINPLVMKNLKEIIIMGGAINVCGNQNRVAEFNMFVDPIAADIVFKFPFKKTLVPLDACNHVQMSLDDFKRIRNDKIRLAIINMVTPYIKNIDKYLGVNAALMYDPLTVYFLINPDVCKTNYYDLVIETKGEFTEGMTVVEKRKVVSKNYNVKVVEYIDGENFKEDFINILSF